MQGELSFVPRILLCGDEAEFLSRVGRRPFEIVGRAKLFGEVDGQPLNFLRDGKIFLDGKIQHFNELLDILRGGTVDYLVFTTLQEFNAFNNVVTAIGFLSSKIMTLEQFKTMTLEFFYDINAELQLLAYLKNFAVKTLLDADACFAKGRLFTKGDNDFTAIDCVYDKPLLPVKENLYRRVYKNFAEVGFRRYDAALIAERPPVDFMSAFVFLEKFSDRVMTFARPDSELEKYILSNINTFSVVEKLQSATGNWFFITRHTPKEDFCIYVVTHKLTPHDGKLPDGYKIIHAGRATATEDFGYLGDDTGDNISHLNFYVNEITALYWFWKNANHTVVGLCHYRRFFTTADDTAFAYDKILTKDAALKILRDCDIIALLHRNSKNQNQHGLIETDCGVELTKLGEAIIRKYLLQTQPDYLYAFDYVLNSTTFYKCNMFVTRRDVFDAYCKWLFSFYIDATREVLRTVSLQNLPNSQRRLMGFFAERIFSVWLIKNHLRIKELPIMEVKNI